MLDEGISEMVHRLDPLLFDLANQNRIKLRIADITIAPPTVPSSMVEAVEKRVFPSECRQKNDTYAGMCTITLEWELDGIPQPPLTREMGRIPIMLRSRACNLYGLSPEELVARGEHEDEWGGNFVVRGNEKLIRMLVTTRRNFPIAISRNTWRDRGKDFSSNGIFIRCVRSDQHSTKNVLHYLTNGSAKLMINVQRSLSFIPIVMLLKALCNYSDHEIYRRLIASMESDQYYKRCILNMLRELHTETLHSSQDCRRNLGEAFRYKLTTMMTMPRWYTDEQAGAYLLRQCVLIHLDSNEDKFNLLVHMMQKLFAFVQGRVLAESLDMVMMQELVLGGHIYQSYLRTLCLSTLQYVRINLTKLVPDATSPMVTSNELMMALKNVPGYQNQLTLFLATGNMPKANEMGLMQETGLVVIAENINRMRYMSHFRAVHRGSFFVTMRTTEARQLLPDAWGFICPVHTPDGAPCGLLNHLTSNCTVSVTQDPDQVDNIALTLVELGMHPIDAPSAFGGGPPIEQTYVVMLEGKVIGRFPRAAARLAVQKLRELKIEGETIPNTTEIAFVPAREGGQWPGIFLFVGPSRMMRPVKNLLCRNRTELIGSFEQVYMDICVAADEAYPALTTHMEPDKTSFLSNLALLIPMPDCNQSPRNMYQCQMGKQTMGTPCHNWGKQCNSKLYRLQTPATPLFRPVHHDNLAFDNYAMGTNAIVAVVSYTGYDMEDAMIINKSAYERGFAAGCIYKNECVELTGESFFARDPKDATLVPFLDNDGLPYQGAQLTKHTPMYCYFDANDHKYHCKPYPYSEDAIVDQVKLGTPLAEAGRARIAATPAKQLILTYRVPRNPTVGDKFASRAGQKGICSQQWPAIDLPFTESGMIPDIIFNPHGFPSRMTIAMMIETMAGKTAACHGLVHDATPFRYDESNTAIDYFGRLLEQSGYDYYGTERMYSGVDGREMKADIFFGVVHYQRLRHMVSDKWQVRSTGPIDQVTHQPNKGRARGGGVRFGEMERDGLISHGASFLLQDRLLHGSDKVVTLVCRRCGCLLAPMDSVTKRLALNSNQFEHMPATCRLCEDDKEIGHVEIPYVFKYLVSQLSAMNINVKLQLSYPDV